MVSFCGFAPRLRPTRFRLAALPRSLVAWDLDNVRPPLFRESAQSLLTGLGALTDLQGAHVVLAGNTWTITKLLGEDSARKRRECDALIQWGEERGMRIEAVETQRRRQAVDRQLSSSIMEFLSQTSEQPTIVVISNDSDFQNIIAYAGQSATTITAGTCRPTRNANAAWKAPNAKLARVADRTIRIEWINGMTCKLIELMQ
jgi:hypothetical protein